MKDPDENPGGSVESSDRDEDAATNAGPTLAGRLLGAGAAVGAAAMIVSAALWAADLLGWKTGVPYVLIGVGGLIAYNLCRLPAYLRRILPKPEAPGPKFHRRGQS